MGRQLSQLPQKVMTMTTSANKEMAVSQDMALSLLTKIVESGKYKMVDFKEVTIGGQTTCINLVLKDLVNSAAVYIYQGSPKYIGSGAGAGAGLGSICFSKNFGQISINSYGDFKGVLNTYLDLFKSRQQAEEFAELSASFV